jgi:hypothetical protein
MNIAIDSYYTKSAYGASLDSVSSKEMRNANARTRNPRRPRLVRKIKR